MIETQTTIATAKKRYAELGYALIDNAVPDDVVDELCEEADRQLETSTRRGGVRNLLDKSDRFRRESQRGASARLATQLLGSSAHATKLTLFNKTAAANWLIRWHQDLTITVRERLPVDGFSGWSLKEGVLHVRAPIDLLRRVVALRLHLDDTPSDNGALRVVPGSHKLGRLTREQIDHCRERCAEVVCEVPRGGIMIMSPLLLHASAKASSPHNRRVLHFEYSAAPLPGGLQWA